MPIFEYLCSACGERFENLVPRADAPDPPCPRCGAQRPRRQLSVFAVPRAKGDDRPGPCGSEDCACRKS
jgi:putative FmdB family regulatory protein